MLRMKTLVWLFRGGEGCWDGFGIWGCKFELTWVLYVLLLIHESGN